MYHNKDMQVNVNRLELVKQLKQNRATHQKDWQEATTGFRIEIEKELKNKLKQLKSGKRVELSFENSNPEDHSPEYTDVIGMLELSVDDVVSLNYEQYKNYYQDEWDWKRSWNVQNNGYIVSASMSGKA